MRHNSAAIARIGDIDSQFSHLGMVHVDDTGKPWVVESLIEDGAMVNPLEVSLGHGLGRAILFRHRDAALAARASRFIHDRVARSRKNFLLRIHYDFSMRLEGYRRLFCSKLVRQAYDVASRGRVKLPTFGTRLDMKNRDFFHRIGVSATETFAPGDIELEPDFDVIAEWRDFRTTSDLRMQDLLMDKLFEWMDLYGYRFRETLVIRLIGFFGKLSSYLSDEAKALLADVVPKVPINMPRRTIATIAMLHKTAEPLFEELKTLEMQAIARTGRPMHPREVREILERVRARVGSKIGYLVAKA
jgi:Permuted papain-like amidase enzyme, YaeF/YiiX, C92 family